MKRPIEPVGSSARPQEVDQSKEGTAVWEAEFHCWHLTLRDRIVTLTREQVDEMGRKAARPQNYRPPNSLAPTQTPGETE